MAAPNIEDAASVRNPTFFKQQRCMATPNIEDAASVVSESKSDIAVVGEIFRKDVQQKQKKDQLDRMKNFFSSPANPNVNASSSGKRRRFGSSKSNVANNTITKAPSDPNKANNSEGVEARKFNCQIL